MPAFLWLIVLFLCHVTHLTETEAAPNQNGGGEPEVDDIKGALMEALQKMHEAKQIEADVKRQDPGIGQPDAAQGEGSNGVDPDANSDTGSNTAMPADIHGGVKMGEITHDCDDLTVRIHPHKLVNIFLYFVPCKNSEPAPGA